MATNYDPDSARDYSVLMQHPELVKAAEDYIEACSKLRIFKPGDLLMGLPLTIPQAAYFHKLGYQEGYVKGQKDMTDAMEQALAGRRV